MSRNKLEVVELNKKENRILLEKKDNFFLLLFKRRGLLFYLLLIFLILSFVGLITLYTLWKINKSEGPHINPADEKIEIGFDDNIDSFVFENITPVTEDYANNYVSKKNNFLSKGEILVLKKVESSAYTIYYFSDGFALRVSKNGEILRIGSLDNRKYGINDEGIVDTNAITSNITIKKMVKSPYGNITYYSDGSALITDSDMDMFVRNSNDIYTDYNYISINKVNYLKNDDKIGNKTIEYFYDGTILVTDGNNKYIVRNSEDIIIDGNSITFPNKNQATVINTKNLDNNIKVTYYSDGGATINIGSNIISVRRSNSIIIEDNKLIEIIDNDLVDISYKNGNTTYYTNGSGTVNYNGSMVYVPDNSNIKYSDNNKIKDIDEEYSKLDSNKKLEDKEVSVYGEYTIIKSNDETKIVPTDSVVYDTNGYVKDVTSLEESVKEKELTIRNNTNDKVSYRVVLEKSNNTTLDTQYIRYILSYNLEHRGPGKLDDLLSKDDAINKQLGIEKTNYILLDASLEAYQIDKIGLSLWADYDTIPNSMMDKSFLGTIKVYAYTEK